MERLFSKPILKYVIESVQKKPFKLGPVVHELLSRRPRSRENGNESCGSSPRWEKAEGARVFPLEGIYTKGYELLGSNNKFVLRTRRQE